MGCSSSSRLTESGKKPLGGAPSAGGNGREYTTVQPFAPTPENLRGAIGERRGQPIGIERALEGANPFYAQATISPAVVLRDWKGLTPTSIILVILHMTKTRHRLQKQ